MPRSDLFIKVHIQHDAGERVVRLGEEICRAIRKMHGVRSAELSSWFTHPDEPEEE